MEPGKDGGKSLNGNKLDILSCLSDCKNLCDQHPECNGFLFDSDEDTCQLRRLNATDTFNLKQRMVNSGDGQTNISEIKTKEILYYYSNIKVNTTSNVTNDFVSG